MQVEAHLRKALSKLTDNLRQDISCLRVRGGYRQCAFLLLDVVGRKAADIVDLLQDDSRTLYDLFAGRRYAIQALALAHE